MKVVIDREKWLQGEGADASALLRSTDGKMCCLGFLALACGMTPEQIKNAPSPRELDDTSKLPEWVDDRDGTPDARSAMLVNDDRKMAHAAKEKRLTRLFLKQGIKLSFKGKYPNRRKKVQHA